MNTPKFQLRKLQRQVIKERDYTEGLENELSTKIADIAQKGNRFYRLYKYLLHFSTYLLHLSLIHISVVTVDDAFVSSVDIRLCFFLERHINQLQWCLDKLKKEQTDGEHAAREQITELEIKSDM